MTRIAIVCGNGISVSRRLHAGVELHPSQPFGIDVRHPELGSNLLESLPHLQDWLAQPEIRELPSDFARIEGLVGTLPRNTNISSLTDRLTNILLDLRHFLCLAYATYQERIDTTPIKSWEWYRWLRRYSKHLICALSWNYDLVLERALKGAGVKHHYPGACGWHERHGRRLKYVGIPVSKPHGSCNFVADGLSVANRMTPNGPLIPQGYPRATNIAISSAPLTTIADHRLLSVRVIADLVLPGEYNVFGAYLPWMQLATSAFQREIAFADTLIVVGFRMAECDAAEFRYLLGPSTRFKRIAVCDPNPSEALLDLLATRTEQMSRWLGGPEMI